MTNRILCSALVAAVLVWPLAACQSASDSRVQIVKTSIAEDPDLEVVATDEGAGILTVRVKSSNELVTVNVNELKEGEPLVNKTRGAAGQSAAVTVRSASRAARATPPCRCRASRARRSTSVSPRASPARRARWPWRRRPSDRPPSAA
jgi:hypothetical protein